jgi:cysteine-rich repeat protein
MGLRTGVPSERWLALIVGSAALACSSSGMKPRSPDGAQAADVAPATDGAGDSVLNLSPDVPALDSPAGDGADDSVLISSPDVLAFDSPAARMDAGFCGDGWIDLLGEECDDGNTLDGDGCSSDCKYESWGCDRPGNPCPPLAMCGDGRQYLGEECDDGNTSNGDGCSNYCQVEAGWRCSVPGRPCRPICGDGLKVAWETCDDGNTHDGDGCASDCLVESCWDCAGGSCIHESCGDGGQDDDAGEAGAPHCGDGIVSLGEQCDDGEGNSEQGYGNCTTQCKLGPYCGDGQVDYPEECDQGSANGTPYGKDGCTFACRQPPYCGDGVVDAVFGEQCDLGYWNGLKVGPGDAGTVLCDETCRLRYPL